MKPNECYNINFLNNTLPDKCAQLIIADPPYFEVKGEFDFVWANMDEYLADVERWAKECKRLLADNGTLFWWGHALKIAYSQVILDKHFTLLNSLVWEKTECQHRRSSPNLMRTFAPVTERCLMYSTEWDIDGLNEIAEKPTSYLNIKAYLREERKKAGLNAKKCYEICGVYTVNMHCFGDSQWEMITKENYQKLQASTGYFQKPYEALRQEYEALRQEYEALRQEYEALRRPYNQDKLQTDVLKYSQEAHKTKEYNHPTQKPEKLTAALINTCSRSDDLVLIPFAGSGTECVMSAKYNRNWIGFDIEQKYCDMTNNRAKLHEQQQTLF